MGCSASKDTTNSKDGAASKGGKDGKTTADRKVAWERIRCAIPRDKDAESKSRRIELFKRFDTNGTGKLSFREVLDGCYSILKLDEFTTHLPGIVQRAFDKAKDLGNKVKGVGEEDLVEFLEFRLMLCYIYDIFELTVMFDTMDKDGSLLIELQEFKEALPKLKEWGVDITDATTVFNEIDTNGSGVVTFDEFSCWAVTKKLQVCGDPDGEGAAKTTADRKVAWERIRCAIPRDKDAESKSRRIELFKQFDTNGTGKLGFREVLDGCYSVLKLDEFTTHLPDIVQRAFDKAKDLGNRVKGVGEEDLVEFLEFRLMLCYIYDIFELTVMFDTMDKDGSLLLELQEFKEALPKLKEWGVDITDATTVFNEIDTNGSGVVTFDEFSCWAVTKKLQVCGDPDGEENGANEGN
ncbi:flagellar calcium-binding protein TB-44A [Trypanosoma brucei brucei TREU927]|uniref:Flagellar calcium-binding protein TB-44A n=2 Tax=Trypanosoma brucei TaxID=5691 RepID=Q57UL8_TRYB2|nr:flagellar calcium-binding protein TB-44A [Trypanosoma brucei brucei TREU927]AAX70701.1 flagellar calcium-binding protein TB-44A [Trypanosoma brucei]AAZ13310.1 flagellar calcium-binding protein TB-44A [Trypanosoma brucei brucei TREU927]